MGTVVASVGFIINLTLFFVKFYISGVSNSLSIYLDSINNLMDSLVCVAAGFAFILATHKSDKKYPFGFGRIEGVVNFLISVIILITGLSFAYSSVGRLMYPLPVWYSRNYAIVIAATIPVKLFLLILYKTVNFKLKSDTVGSLGLDSLLDFFITSCTLVSLTLSNRFSYSFDGIAGLAISVILAVQGFKAVKNAFAFLLGRKDEKLCSEIENIFSQDSEILEVENVDCHLYGKTVVVNADIVTENNVVTPSLEERLMSGISYLGEVKLYLKSGGNNRGA